MIVSGLMLAVGLSAKDDVKGTMVVDNLFPSHGLTDPHVWIEDGRIYLFGGHDESWDTDDTWRMNRWEIWSSDNLKDWRFENKILPTQTYIGDQPNCWAGDIAERDGKYYWYFSNRNTNTGVCVSDKITGDYKDALGKPLLDKSLIEKGHPYDPEIFIENGEYYIIFGSGQYSISKLNRDMISLAETPKRIDIKDAAGKPVYTADKSAMFKRNDTYYLVWGGQYATSDKLYGPYLHQGEFLEGGHNSIFEWENEWYVVQENKDISLFYRGISLKHLTFDDKGLVIVPEDDIDYPGDRRSYDFKVGEMGWRALDGTTLEWNKRNKSLKGKISGNASIQSAMWLVRDTDNYTKIRLRMKNLEGAKTAKVFVSTMTPKGAFWSDPNIDWSKEQCYTIELQPKENGVVEYEVPIKKGSLQPMLKALRIDPAVGVEKGKWEIEYFSID